MEYDSNNQLVKENIIKIIEAKALNSVINQQIKPSERILGVAERNLKEALELKVLAAMLFFILFRVFFVVYLLSVLFPIK